jgi:soluble lytic murein transglycosylase
MKKLLVLSGLLIAACMLHLHAWQDDQNAIAAAAPAPRLLPTNHPRLPRELSLLWLAPGGASTGTPAASREFATALKLIAKDQFTKALPMLKQPALEDGPLGLYALFYSGIAEQELDRHDVAIKTLRELQSRQPVGYLAEAAPLAEAASLEALKEHRAAADIYLRLSQTRTTAPEEVLWRLGRAARNAGDARQAGDAYARIYYEFPLGDYADGAGLELGAQPIEPGGGRFKLELGRAERLFAARRYPAARAAFDKLRSISEGRDRELVRLRLAECDYFLKKYRPAKDALRPFVEESTRLAEALYFHALTAKALGDRITYDRAIRRIVNEFPTESWAEEALNSLATDRILQDEDGLADEVFRELYGKYPRGVHAERAAWKVGWRSYRFRRYDETAQIFEQAAADFPRSDYRPAWLYWAGRARQALSENTRADERYLLVTADYLNTYYGRLAAARLKGRRAPPRIMVDRSDAEDTPSLLPPPGNEATIRALLDIDAYELAMNEIRYAERAWGNSPALNATEAWISRQQGQSESGTVRFNFLRGSITVMKRAYPQYMAAGGEELPRDVLAMIFPLEYWDLIRKYSAPHGLDPYMVAALMAQESTFVRDIKSHAGAYGLMQLKPGTARQYARRFNIRYAPSLLTNADANVRFGTAYLADKIKEFGGIHLALASYNAGETPVRRWVAERPGLTDQEEFIDDIPYPETQNYVKKLLGTAEDYRRLYGGSGN